MKSGHEQEGRVSDEHQAPPRCGVGLRAVIETSDKLSQVAKADVAPGDWIFVKTVNSLYRIHVRGDGLYEVTGGWFDRNRRSPMTVRISGCSWGGSIIKTTLVAACGLFVEFGNKLVTTQVLKIIILRLWCLN